MTSSIDPRFNQVLSAVRSGGNRVAMADGSVRFIKSTTELFPSIRHEYPLGVDLIIIGESQQMGWSPADQFASNGVVVIQIGLLVPAVQRIREPARRRSTSGLAPDPSGLLSLKGLLRPNGRIFVIGADGKMLSVD